MGINFGHPVEVEAGIGEGTSWAESSARSYLRHIILFLPALQMYLCEPVFVFVLPGTRELKGYIAFALAYLKGNIISNNPNKAGEVPICLYELRSYLC